MKAEETSTSYRAPIADILFAMTHEAGMDLGLKDGIYADLGDGLAEATVTEAGKFAEKLATSRDFPHERKEDRGAFVFHLTKFHPRGRLRGSPGRISP
jgi:hypothetical protein